MFRAITCCLLTVLVLLPGLALAQGLLIDDRPDHAYRLPRPRIWPHPVPPRPPRPEPPQSYKIQEIAVNATITDQVGKVQVSQSFVNTGSRQMEVSFVFPLPYDGAVDQMTFMVDGKEYEAKLLTAKEARSIYEGHIRRNQDPALLEWMGTGMFKTSVFPVPPGAKRTVTLRYSQICRKTQGLTEWLFPLSTAKYTSQPVETIKIDATIRSSAKLKNIYSPTHSIELKRPTDSSAHIAYTVKNQVPTTDFRLMYDVGDQPVSASALSYRPDRDDEGYFLLLVSPEIKRASEKPLPKTVVFVVDRSGSMSGKKIEQAKGALKFVLNNLHEGDLFNIIAYDSAVESFQPELQRFDEQTRGQALGFVEGIYAGGSTNIDGALQAAMSQLQDTNRPTYIIFLTDGLPTAGERREPQIVANAKQANTVRARMFSFGVGYDVNSRLLDRLARVCHGQSQYVRPNEDIEESVSQLYRRIGAPAMVNVSIDWDLEDFPAEKGSLVNRVYPRGDIDLFAGDQLVLVGRYKKSGQAKVTIRGMVDQTEQAFDFPAQLVDYSSDESQAFVEKLWAMRRVGEIIDEIDLQGKNQELVNELVALATKHGILTPYTSFLADETNNYRDLATNAHGADFALDALQMESGAGGFLQRAMKNDMQQAQTAPAAGYGRGSGLEVRGGIGGGAGGYGYGMPGGAAAAPADRRARSSSGSSAASRPAGQPSGATVVATSESDAQREVSTVLNVGKKTFFFRNNRWEDSVVTDAQLTNVQKLTRYSAEYFELAKKFGRDAARYLAIEGNVLVVLGDTAYEF